MQEELRWVVNQIKLNAEGIEAAARRKVKRAGTGD